MQPAVGPAKHMTGILMGAETQDSHGKPFVLVVPDVIMYDPAMSDSLIPVGRLIEAGFSVNHRIPSQANEDGFSLKAVPLYGGTITTPDGKTMIVMEYAQHTWRLPLPSNKRVSKPKMPPRATSEIFVDLRSAGSSFIDPTIHSTCWMRLTMWMTRATCLLTSLRIGLRDGFSNATSSCFNVEKRLKFTILLTDTATIAKLY